jgi:DNA-binding response OmpR family regulator
MTASKSLSDSTRCDPTLMGTVVVVEDPLVSKLVRAVLQRCGYQVTLAAPEEAAALLAAPESNIGALVTNSPEAFLEFSDRVPLLYLSSSPDALMAAAFRSCRVVVKPFVPEELVRAVRDLISA